MHRTEVNFGIRNRKRSLPQMERTVSFYVGLPTHVGGGFHHSISLVDLALATHWLVQLFLKAYCSIISKLSN